ncbi:MAG: RNA methyltransferase [Flavobacterium sp. BFFFF2]|nr:MAG: RNA methyltransferase [Flavobacterium sp. BFFFF2]
MISKNQIKFIRSLHLKKNRLSERLFIAEGVKAIDEFVKSGWQVQAWYGTKDFYETCSIQNKSIIDEKDLKSISCLTTPQGCLALFSMPPYDEAISNGFILALDDIRDPGNMGTLIRLCDWFGVDQIWCSPTCVEIYNPKVVQASMGSLARVKVCITDLSMALKNTDLPIFGAFMNGTSIYERTLPSSGILVLGNEANGIHPLIESFISDRISIPQGNQHGQTESLNVATAGAILLNEWRRNQ